MNRAALGLALASLTLTACGGGGGAPLAGGAGGTGGTTTGSGLGTITLEATDKPFDLGLVSKALVRVDSVRMHTSSDATDGFVDLGLEQPVALDLAELRNGVTEFLLSKELPTGDYTQARFVISRARLELVNGNVYDTQDGTIKLSSQGTSGFKIFMAPAIEVREGEATRVLLDFDLSKTFKPIPGNDPLTATSYKLHPVIRAVNMSTTGEIRGVVEEEHAQGNTTPAGGAVVHVVPMGETDLDQSITTTATEDDGSFALLGLDPGMYDVIATKDTMDGSDDAVSVAVGGVADTGIVVR